MLTLTGFPETVGVLIGTLLDEEVDVAADELDALEELAGLLTTVTLLFVTVGGVTGVAGAA